jgi:hypothetical protein
MCSATGKFFNCVYLNQTGLQVSVPLLLIVVVATMNLFSLNSLAEDQFKPPRKSKDGAGKRAGRRMGDRGQV